MWYPRYNTRLWKKVLNILRDNWNSLNLQEKDGKEKHLRYGIFEMLFHISILTYEKVKYLLLLEKMQVSQYMYFMIQKR